MGRLRILTAGVEPAVLELSADVATLGRREDNSLCVPDGSISGRHCELAEADGFLTILDLGSTNGTFIGGERCERGTVPAGGTFKLGGIEFCYEADVAAAAPAPAIVAPAPVIPAPAAPVLIAPEPQPQLPVVAPVAPAPPPAPVIKPLVAPTPAPAPAAPASAPAVPRLSPAEALKQSLAKAPAPPPRPPEPEPAPAPVAPLPAPVVKPAPGSVVPTGGPSKLALGHSHGETSPTPAPAAEPAAAKPGVGKVVPTGAPSKLSLGHSAGHAPSAPPAPAVAVAPTGGASKLALGGHKPAAPAAPTAAEAPAVVATPTALPPGAKPCKHHPTQAVQYVCKKCRAQCCETCAPGTEIAGKIQHFCPVCKNLCLTLAQQAAVSAKSLVREGQTFTQRLPGVFKYPFNKGGALFLVLGTIVFVALDFASMFSWKFAILGIGYLFAYMQKIVRSSAEAEEELPGFPEVSEWRTELLRPFFLLAWTFVVSFGPAFGYMIWHTANGTEMSLPVLFPLFALGFLYFPMALLAVAMSASYAAVNPLVVLPAITRLNLEYVGATAVFFALVTARYLSETLLRAAVPVPVLPTLISGFLALYFLACEMRLLGLIYYEHKRKLGWFSH